MLLTACASSPKAVPIAVHSDPLGSFTVMQVQYRDGNNSDWIYIGVTPVDINRSFNVSDAKAVTIRVMKEGFFEQTKTWEINEFNALVKSQGRVLWVPHLVKTSQ
jgi:hypothetical protein